MMRIARSSPWGLPTQSSNVSVGLNQNQRLRKKKVIPLKTLSFLLPTVCLGCLAYWSLLLERSHATFESPRRLKNALPKPRRATITVDTAPKSKSIANPNTETMSYMSALATLACFATPDCFPSAKCNTGVPQKLQRKKKWEEQSFCVDDLNKKKQTTNECLVYSFGIESSTEWEEKVAKEFGCQVHAFDPTVSHKTNIAPGVTFHKLGLQAQGTDMSATHAHEYGAIDPKLLLTLPEIQQRLGHENRTIDVLMLDCEGCEWGVLKTLACSKDSSRCVKQLMTEFHFQKNLGLASEADVLVAAAGIQCLWDERWQIVSTELSGAAPVNWEYTKGVNSVLHSKGMLLYTTLQRIPEAQPSPGDLLEETAAVEREISEFVRKAHAKYGQDQSKWPVETNSAWASLTALKHAKSRRYKQTARNVVAFDTFERYPEKARQSERSS